MEKRPNRPSLPALDEFKLQFRRKFGRDMTADEIRFYGLTDDLLHHPPEEEDGEESDVAAGG